MKIKEAVYPGLSRKEGTAYLLPIGPFNSLSWKSKTGDPAK